MPDQDQIIDASMARSIQSDVARNHPLTAWVPHGGKFVARLVAEEPSPYVMLADTLAELRARLPPALERVDRQSSYAPEVVEIWFVPERGGAGTNSIAQSGGAPMVNSRWPAHR
jgi:hypothetical protein